MVVKTGTGGARSADDTVLPFQVEGLNVRGRIARLGPALDTILRQHAYPRPVSRLLGEAIALVAAVGSSLKYDGVFSVQAKGDGPIRLMVVDVTSAGHLRGYAQLAGRPIATEERRLDHLIGKGQLAFTVDQGQDTERYQGIVALGEDTLAGAVDHYFKQSEQLETRVILAAGLTTAWRSTALMIQRLPGDASDPDAWNRTLHLIESLTEDELLDPDLAAEDLLYRLFHIEGVRVFTPRPMEARCRCTRERAEGALRLVPEDELPGFMVDGRFIVTTSSDETARLWDADSGKFVREFKGHKYAVLCAEFSKDGQWLVTGGEDNSARVWNVETAASLLTLSGHTASVTSVAFSPDLARVISGSQDQVAKLWDSKTGKEILTLSRHTEDVTSVTFSPDGRQVLTGSRDGTAVIWLSQDWADKKVLAAERDVPVSKKPLAQ